MALMTRPMFKAIAAAVGLTLLAAACSDDAGGGSRDLAEAASAALDAPEERLVFDDPIALEPSACTIAPVWDADSLNPYPLQFAVLADGTVIEGFSDKTLQRVLESCFFEQDARPTAEAMAQAVVELGQTPGPLAVVEPGEERRLEEAGLDYKAPQTTEDGGTFEVTFLAKNLEFRKYYDVTATREDPTRLTVTFVELGP